MAVENKLMSLPDDLLNIIFSHLDDKTKLSLKNANKRLYNVFCDNYEVSELIKNHFMEEMIKFHSKTEQINKNGYIGLVLKMDQIKEKELLNDRDAQVLSPSLVGLRNNVIQKAGKVKTKDFWVMTSYLVLLVIAFGLFVAYLFGKIAKQSFMDGYPPESCSTRPDIIDCQHRVDEYLVDAIKCFSLLGIALGAALKFIDFGFFKSERKNILDYLLPNANEAYLINIVKSYALFLFGIRSYVAFVVGACFLTATALQKRPLVNVKNCIIGEDSNYRFEENCITDQVNDSFELMVPLALCMSMFLTYSSFSVLKLLMYTVPKKAISAFKECYQQHGFFGADRVNENTYLLANMARLENV